MELCWSRRSAEEGLATNELYTFYHKNVNQDSVSVAVFSVALAAVLLTAAAFGAWWWPRLARERVRHLRAQEALERSEARYRSIFETAPVSIWELDFSGARAILADLHQQGVADVRQHLAANPVLKQEALGLLFVRDLNREGLLLCGADSVAELQAHLPEIFLPETERLMEDLMTAMAGGGRALSGETALLTLQGARRDVMYGLLLPEPDEASAVVLVTIMDISARKRVEEELREANRELDLFTSSVSHDLRAPLRHMSGFAQMLHKSSRDRLDERGQHQLDVVWDASRRMGELLDDLLEFARMSRAEVRRRPVDLERMAREISEELAAQSPGRPVEWLWGPLPEVRADPALMRLVFQNLVGNALKYTRGRETARVELGARREEKELVVYVRDNGVGFDMRYAPKLFGIFQRLHRAEEFEGTGIGLASVRRIVERHGGRTWAEGEPGQGATFYFTLPAGGGGVR
jgi:signal transduction histidine kinase